MDSKACEGFESLYKELGESLALQKFHLSHLGMDLQSDTTVDCSGHPRGPCNFCWAKSRCPRKKGGTSFLQRALGVLGGDKGLKLKASH